LKLKKQTNKAF